MELQRHLMEHRAWRDSLLEIAAFPASSAMKRNSSPAFVISQPRPSTDLEIYIEPLFYLDSLVNVIADDD